MTRLVVDANVAIKWLLPEEHPSEPLCDLAWDVARWFDRSFYDSLYLALSVSDACPLVTADLRLYNALRNATGFSLFWIGDVKEGFAP